MAYESNNDNVEKLIEAYRGKPELWNPRDSFYHNRNKKQDAWADISETMICHIDEAKTKINSLLSSFRRERAKAKKSMGTGKGKNEIYESSWFAFKSFEFLMDRDSVKNTVTTEQNSEEEKSSTQDSDIVEDIIDTSNDVNTEHAASCSEGEVPKRKVFNSPKLPKNKQRKKEEKDPRLLQAYSILDNVQSRNECSSFGESVSARVRKFEGIRRYMLMNKINNVIFEAEMELYAHSHQEASNSSSSSGFDQTPHLRRNSSVLQEGDNFYQNLAPVSQNESLQAFVNSFQID